MRFRVWMLAALLACGLAGGGVLQIYLPARRDWGPAQTVLRQFMMCRLSRDEACVRAHLAGPLHSAYVATGEPDLIGGVDPHYHSYRILSRSKLPDGSWRFEVQIEEQLAGKGPTGWFRETLLLLPAGDSYLVAEVTKAP